MRGIETHFEHQPAIYDPIPGKRPFIAQLESGTDRHATLVHAPSLTAACHIFQDDRIARVQDRERKRSGTEEPEGFFERLAHLPQFVPRVRFAHRSRFRYIPLVLYLLNCCTLHNCVRVARFYRAKGEVPLLHAPIVLCAP